MNISDLKVGQGKVEVEASVVDKSSPREFEKFGKKGKVCEVKIKDSTGEIKLTLWNEQVDSVNIGNKIKIANGYVSEFHGEKQLSTGRFGQIEVIDNTSKDLGEHILTNDEKEESEALNGEFTRPDGNEEITEDEQDTAEIEKPKQPSIYDDSDYDENIDIDEEKVE